MPTSKKLSVVLFFLLFLQGCMCLGYLPLLECRGDYSDERYSSPSYYYTNYPINLNKKTRSGIKYDDSGISLNMDQQNKIDRSIDELEKCLGIKVTRCAVKFKIVNDYRFSPDGKMEFPCKANERGWCYAIIQYPAVIVIPPEFEMDLIKHEEYHVITGSMHLPGKDFTLEEKRCLQ